MDGEPTSRRPFQAEFWDEEAATAQFSHPLDESWLSLSVDLNSGILDYGCGYGRTLAWLFNRGYTNLTGLDISTGMLARAGKYVPRARLIHAPFLPTVLPDASFDLVLLLAVLTAVPENRDQEAITAEICRLLRPGGHAIVSDLLLQTDERRITRYRTARPEGLPYGTFVLEGGRAVMRHHDASWFDVLFSNFVVINQKSITADTMRGHPATITQLLLRKPSN